MSRVPTRITLIVIALTLSTCGYGQSTHDKDSSSEAVTLPDLGIRYTPPVGMVDKTTPDVKQARERANSYTTKAAQLLLDVSSAEGDDAADWHQIWMFHFPRAQLSKMSDGMAEAKVNNALAGAKAVEVGQPKGAFFGGHSFLVSEFEQNEPPLTKHAKIYTTICKSQLVSFVFVSNSADQISGMEDSLKSLSFSAQ